MKQLCYKAINKMYSLGLFNYLSDEEYVKRKFKHKFRI